MQPLLTAAGMVQLHHPRPGRRRQTPCSSSPGMIRRQLSPLGTRTRTRASPRVHRSAVRVRFSWSFGKLCRLQARFTLPRCRPQLFRPYPSRLVRHQREKAVDQVPMRLWPPPPLLLVLLLLVLVLVLLLLQPVLPRLHQAKCLRTSLTRSRSSLLIPFPATVPSPPPHNSGTAAAASQPFPRFPLYPMRRISPISAKAALSHRCFVRFACCSKLPVGSSPMPRRRPDRVWE